LFFERRLFGVPRNLNYVDVGIIGIDLRPVTNLLRGNLTTVTR
jgi:hypothetical protein